MTGDIYGMEAEYHKGDTVLKKSMFDQDSLLLKMEPVENVECEDTACGKVSSSDGEKVDICAVEVPDQVEILRSEPNVSILDLAEYAFDGGEWHSQEEILRIDNLFRENLGYPLRMEAFAQPWTNDRVEGFDHTLSLRFPICTETALTGCFLAMENDENTEILLDGRPVENKAQGWYVDHCIRRVALPDMEAGSHRLQVNIPYNSKVNIEAMFLLGDFRVEIEGRMQTLKKDKKEAAFCDITRQGYPFYGGNITYRIPFTVRGGEVSVRASLFRAPVLHVSVDGKDMGHIAFSPYEAGFGKLPKGEHLLELTVYGNRVNTFGTLHNCDKKEEWFGPNAWRTTGDLWSYEYQLKESGLLKAPVITEKIYE